MNRIIAYFLDNKPKRKLKQSEFSVFSHEASSTQKKKVIESVIKEANKDQRKTMERARRIQTAN